MAAFIDGHAHLTHERFDGERDAVIGRAREAGLRWVITVPSRLGDDERCADLAARHPFIRFTAGVHPHEAKGWSAGVAADLRATARRPGAVAIGEIGLDYHYDLSPRDAQRSVFREQIGLARELGLPLVIHTREAWDDTLAILAAEGADAIGGMFHCFSGGPEEASRCMELGFLLSFAGPITFRNPGRLPEVAAAVPLDRLLIETDSPFLAPHPHRGQRNEPARVVMVAERIAALRGVPADAIGGAATRNLERLFRLTAPDLRRRMEPS